MVVFWRTVLLAITIGNYKYLELLSMPYSCQSRLLSESGSRAFNASSVLTMVGLPNLLHGFPHWDHLHSASLRTSLDGDLALPGVFSTSETIDS